MVVISSSKLRLDPGEAVTDPAIRDVTWVTKRIGDRTYEAMVKTSQTGKNGEHLNCFPEGHLPGFQEEPGMRRIRINEWTIWTMPAVDYETLEWVKDEPLQFSAMTQSKLEQLLSGKEQPGEAGIGLR